MAQNKNFFSRVWNWLGHLSRAIWVYKLLLPLVVASVGFLSGLKQGISLAVLIPLTAVTAGGIAYFINQITAFYNQFREGFAYGLAYEGAHLGYNPTRDDAVLQLGVNVRNVTAKPMRYLAERYDVVIGDRTVTIPIENKGGLIPRGCLRTYSSRPFKREQVAQFIGQNAEGSITLEFHYGHPDGPYVRRLRMKLSIAMKLSDPVGIRDLILSESDEEV
jgi:hypothetical protein